MQGQDREAAKRDRPSVRPASIEDADGCARRENTWNEDGRPYVPFGSQGNERRSETSFTISRPPKRRVIAYEGNYRCQQRRRTCRSGYRKIDNEDAAALAIRMQPGPPHPCDRHALRGVKRMLASLHVPAAESTIPPARAMERSLACGLQRHSIGAGCEHDRSRQRSGCRARFRFERYLAGGRSGLSAHFRAAGSRSGSSSQARQT